MNNLSAKIGGILLIIIGVGYLGDQFDIWSFSLFFRGWWALLLAIWGIFMMIENRPNVFNIVITALGAYWFLSINHLIHFTITYKVILAIFLIYVGCRVIFVNYSSHKTEGNSKEKTAHSKSENHIHITSSFASKRYMNDAKVYSCHLENTFGSLFVDLKDADLSEIYEIRIENTFGTLELLLPENVKVISREDNIFASSYVDQSAGEKDIYIKENCVFGSLKILKAKKK